MSELLPLLAGSFTPVTRASAWRAGSLTYDRLPITECEVTVDGDNKIERTVSLTVVSDDPALSVDRVTSILAPFGAEVAVEMGVKGPRRDITVPVGRFMVTQCDPEEVWRAVPVAQLPDRTVLRWVYSGSRIQVRGQDLARRSANARFEYPTGSTASTAYQEINALLRGIAYVGRHEVSDGPLGARMYEDRDRLKALDDVAKTRGARLAWDVHGQAVLKPRDSSPMTWELPADERSILLGIDRSLSQDEFYNAVITDGKLPDSQVSVYGRAEDTNPDVGYYGAAMGRKPYFDSSPFVQSTGAASAAAATTLRTSVMRRAIGIDLEVPYNPELEPFATVTWPGPRGAVSGPVPRFSLHSSGVMRMRVMVPLKVDA